ncbi:MAG TPA: hypothetical protein VM781_01850 [Candidatus Bathyarchaeia archaeon]|nr:hypothetical protein [Candidatus Bathyarchaeia archaeon]
MPAKFSGDNGAVGSERAFHYREQAEQFQRLAKMEEQPRARARLLEIADDYQNLAETEPRKPSAELLGTRTRNTKRPVLFGGRKIVPTAANLSAGTG